MLPSLFVSTAEKLGGVALPLVAAGEDGFAPEGEDCAAASVENARSAAAVVMLTGFSM